MNMTRSIVTSLFVSASLVASAVSFAADPPTGAAKRDGGRMQSCRADAQKFCANVEQGGGRKLICLESHRAELAPDCRDALAQVETMRKNGAAPK